MGGDVEAPEAAERPPLDDVQADTNRKASAGTLVACPDAIVAKILSHAPLRGRLLSRSVCHSWRASADEPSTWEHAHISGYTCSDQDAFIDGLTSLAHRSLHKTTTLSIPTIPAHKVEALLSVCVSVSHLHIVILEDENTHHSDYVISAISKASPPHLRHLKHALPPSLLDSDERYHRSSLRALARNCPNLRSLDFSLPSPSEVAVHRLVDALHHCPLLESLDVSNCSNVDDRILKPLRARSTPLSFINVRGTSLSPSGLESLRSITCSCAA